MINLIQGNSADLDVTVLLDASTYNISGHKAWFTVKNSFSDPDVAALIQITGNASTGIIFTNQASGMMRISLTPTHTLALPLNVPLECDIQLKTTANKIYTIFLDEITVSPRVTLAIT